MNLPRRHFLVAATALVGAPAWAAFSADGPARVRAGAAKSALLDVALSGQRLVAVGERGHVLLSDDQGKSWRQAKAVPTRTTLTAVAAGEGGVLWATGHGGFVLHSADGGENWVATTGKFSAPDVLLAVRVGRDGHGLAVGGFGFALATTDGGQTWREQRLLEGEAGEKHMNRVLVTQAGTWLIAGEGGQVLRGTGSPAVAAMSWQATQTPYKGSLWSGVQLADGTLILGGMRGNLVKSSDDGKTWTHGSVSQAGSFTGATALPDGRPLLVGVDGTVVLGDAAASQWKLARQDDRATLTGAVALPGGAVVASTQAGMRVLELPR